MSEGVGRVSVLAGEVRDTGRRVGPLDPPPVLAPGYSRPVLGLVAVVVTVALGMFLSVLDSAIVGVAYPAIEKELGATSESTQWITTAYKLAQGVAIPVAVWLCRRYGLVRMYLVSLVAYAATSGLCAVADSIDQLVAFRVLQAIPGALTPIVCVGFIYALVPKAKQGPAFGIFAMVAISAPGFAPYLGGVLTEFVSWRAVFFLALPIALLGMVAAVALLPPPRPVTQPPPFDFAGFVCIAVSSCSLLLALSKGPQWGWTSYPIIGLFALGLNAAVAFIAVEIRVPHPILSLRVFALRPFLLGLLVLEVVFIGVTALISFLPVFLEQAQRMTPSQAGAVLVPQAVAWVLAIPVSAVLWQRFGARWVAIFGLALMGGGTLLLSQLTIDAPRGELMLVLVVRAVGLGLVMIPMLGGSVAVLPPHLLPDGIAWRTIVQRTGASLGLAAISAVVTAQRAQHYVDQAGLLDVRAPSRIPELAQLNHRGPHGLVPLWESLQAHSLTLAYDDAYLVLGGITVLAILIACRGNWPTPPKVSRRQLIEAGV